MNIQYVLTHWGQDKMDTISQTTFWSAFSWMKMFEFWLKFHWSWTKDGKITDAYMRPSASMS